MITKFGLLIPLRRAARDFEAGSGGDLHLSKVKQLVCTEPGELPWRTRFGAGLGRLRHQNNDDVLRELARISVRDAFARWMPGTQLARLEASQEDKSLVIILSVNEVREGTAGQVEVMP
jgi:phage baseplate assembly protein W